jgi:alkanesulfonate monooxygenase SsuD/methylene tetrahydromethanopterin reductase-like flavin-dependent oxidoreductase (luciferase family)
MFEAAQFAVIIPPDDHLDTVRPWWREIEALGFDALGIPDTPLLFRDGFLSLAAAALDTSRINLMLSVTNVLTRDPSVMAGSFRALEDLAPGRMYFGFGAGDSAAYGTGLRGASPAAMEHYIGVVRALAAGEEPSYQERKLHAAWREWEPWRPRIMVAAHGERSLRMAGRVGDCVISGFGLLPETIARARELVHNSAADAGRDPENIEFWYICTVCPGDTVEEGFLHSGMGGAFMLVRNGFAGKLVPPELQPALIEVADTYTLDNHSRANQASLEIARRTGVLDYLVARAGGMMGPVDHTAGVQRLHDAGVDNLVFVALGEDKMSVVRDLADALIAKREASSASVP